MLNMIIVGVTIQCKALENVHILMTQRQPSEDLKSSTKVNQNSIQIKGKDAENHEACRLHDLHTSWCHTIWQEATFTNGSTEGSIIQTMIWFSAQIWQCLKPLFMSEHLVLKRKLFGQRYDHRFTFAKFLEKERGPQHYCIEPTTYKRQ